MTTRRHPATPEQFAAFQDGFGRHCPVSIVQFSTGGRGRAMEQRGSMLNLMPDMASRATGRVNFPTNLYENPSDFVRSRASRMRDLGIKPETEVFNLAILYNAADLVAEGLILALPHVQFVFGYATRCRRGAVLFVHPAGSGICSPFIVDYGWRAAVGTSLEDATFLLHMIAKQIPHRYLNIKFIVPHLRGPRRRCC
jgi:hypothetical protein